MSKIQIRPKPVTVTLIPHLEKAGIRVRIRHNRYFSKLPAFSDTYQEPELMARSAYHVRDDIAMLQNGGETVVNLIFPDGREHHGSALCSRHDTFNRHKGIELALKRALYARKIDSDGVHPILDNR